MVSVIPRRFRIGPARWGYLRVGLPNPALRTTLPKNRQPEHAECAIYRAFERCCHCSSRSAKWRHSCAISNSSSLAGA
jgi:hypothetical protein